MGYDKELSNYRIAYHLPASLATSYKSRFLIHIQRLVARRSYPDAAGEDGFAALVKWLEETYNK